MGLPATCFWLYAPPRSNGASHYELIGPTVLLGKYAWCVGAAAVHRRSCQHATNHQSLRVKTNFPQPSPRFPTPRNLGQLSPTFPGEAPIFKDSHVYYRITGCDDRRNGSEIIQNCTDVDRLERLDGLGPENVTPKLELLACLGLEMVESGTDADGLECLGGLGPEMIQNCGAGN